MVPRWAWGGDYREIVLPERIVATEQWDQDWPGGGEDVVTTTFTEQDGNTMLTTTVRYASKAARDVAIASNMDTGMAASYDRLDALFAATD
ncbi:MAG TPA: SRPBCC domain-containing protein [Armatimonadota bacterium]|jgi:uncharacterized protein YndB with AHSA1/START domain